MEKIVGQLMEKYGSRMEVLGAEGWKEMQAFLQPFTSKSWQNMKRQVSALGEIPAGEYVLICPVEAVAEGDTLRMDGKRYRVWRLDTLYYRDTAVYCWGLCKRAGEEDTWGM